MTWVSTSRSKLCISSKWKTVAILRHFVSSSGQTAQSEHSQTQDRSDDQALPRKKQSHLPTESDLHFYPSYTQPPSPAQLSFAEQYFLKTSPSHQPARFLFTCAKFREFPISSTPEIALLGRSNVGKSSLLNALMHRTTSHLAYVSKRPGHTRAMNVFAVGGYGGGLRKTKGLNVAQIRAIKDGKRKAISRPGYTAATGQGMERWAGHGGLHIVDMPGYGKGSREEWGVEILKYLRDRKQLQRAFLLIDSEVGVTNDDTQILKLLRQNGIAHQLVLSKIDKVISRQTQQANTPILKMRFTSLDAVRHKIREKAWPGADEPRGIAPLDEMIACSAEKSLEASGHRKIGIDALRWAILCAAGIENKISKSVVEARTAQLSKG